MPTPNEALLIARVDALAIICPEVFDAHPGLAAIRDLALVVARERSESLAALLGPAEHPAGRGACDPEEACCADCANAYGRIDGEPGEDDSVPQGVTREP